ncbi:ammonium transporter [Novosphingobium gossypii]|uniref:ammonium transporter n=1 Tax=Novosphingobium gossypii TaxID=1604774 RepID=UPI003D229DA4
MTRLSIRAARLTVALVMALAPVAAEAQDGRLDLADGGDTAWLLGATLMAMLALPGLALFQSARVRQRNALSMLLQCCAIFANASVLWVVVGYTLAFGNVGNGWLGQGNAWMLIALGNVRDGTGVPESAFVLFEMVFAMFAPALIAGAAAERARFGWIVLFASLWSLVVLAPVMHWARGGGWLAQGVGTLDWSGGIMVHLSAGVSGLVVAVMLGPRKGIARGQGVVPHAPALGFGGTALLWIGWLGLSGGSALAASDDAAAAMIAMHVGVAGAALAWLAIERMTSGRPTLTGFGNGVMAGIAMLAPAAGYVSPGTALLLGLMGGVTCNLAWQFVRAKLPIDDALSVFAINGIGGALGAMLLAAAVSQTLGGVGYAEGMNPVAQLVAQSIGVVIVTMWSLVATVILALMASLAFPMRVSEDAEREGLDLASHGEKAWNFD